ncbi:MAG TPA: dihydrofolate reductase family protein, partial [Nitrococcus sp.]|nr:dihydrofolate reductase family protein [Nitrococcus sp.]
QPCRFVLDSRLRLPADARILQNTGRVIVLYSQHDSQHAQALIAAGAELWPIEPASAGCVAPAAALAAIGAAGINELLVEAGPTVSGALLQAGLVDELVVYIAPHLMGHEARPLLVLPGLVDLADRIPLTITDMQALGPDLRVTARLEQT